MRRHAEHTAISTTTEPFTTTRLGARGSGDVETGLNPGSSALVRWVGAWTRPD